MYLCLCMIQLILIAISLPGTVAQFTADSVIFGDDVLLGASPLLNTLFQETLSDTGSAIVITDEHSSVNMQTVTQIWNLPKGVSLLEVGIRTLKNNNSKGEQLSILIEMAIEVRKRSWYPLVILYTNNEEFLSQFASLSHDQTLLIWSTKLLIVTAMAETEFQDIMEQNWVLSMMDTSIVQVEGKTPMNRNCRMFSRLPYTPDGKGSVVQVATWSSQRGLALSKVHQIFPNKFVNLYGAPFNVTMWPFMPYFVSFEEITGDSSLAEKYTGRDYMMLETIGNILNFTIYRLPTSGWDEVMLKVMQGESFISPMKMSVLPHLLEDMDFTIAYEPETAAFVMKKPSRKPRWQSLYYPMADLVWASIFGLVFVVPFVLVLTERFQHPKPPKFRLGTWTSFKEIFGTLLAQSLSPYLPSSNAIRVLIVTWIIFSFIVGTVYKGSLTAFLTIPKYPPRVETLPEFLKVGAILLTTPDSIDFYNSFKQSPPGDYRTLSERMYFVPNMRIGFGRLLEENAGYQYERRNLDLKIARYYTQSNGWTPFYVAKENLWPGWSGWPIIKGAPYKPVLDKYIRMIAESGLLEKWNDIVVELFKRLSKGNCNPDTADASNAEAKCDAEELDLGDGTDESGEIKPLTIVHLQGPLFLLAILLSVCTLVFVFEFLRVNELRKG